MAEAPINIKLRCASWQQLANIYKRDLSRHAIFLKSATPPALGTPVRIDLTLPTESMIVLTGSVTEHVAAGGLGGRGPGVDIKLNTIPQSALWLIETALASAQKQQTGSTAAITGAAAPAAPERGGVDAAVDDGQDLAAAEDDLLTALGQELASLRKLNPFQVLGVGYDAGDEEVRSGFAELTKRYHPDRFTRYTSTDLRTLAAEIFILIRDAYRKLGDEASRQKALTSIGARPSVRIPTLRPPEPSGSTSIAGTPGVSSSAPTARAPHNAMMPPRPATPPPVGERTPRPAVPIPPARPERAIPPPPPPQFERTPPPETQRRPMNVAPPTVGDDAKADFRAAEELLDSGRYDEALALFKIYGRKSPGDRQARAGAELAEGMKALAQRDRLEAAQRFETVLEIDPANERAARELAEMRRLATNERKGLLSRLMGKKE